MTAETTPPEAREPSDSELGMAWLLRLRWGAAVGLGVALLGHHWLIREPLPYRSLIALWGVLVSTNVILGRLEHVLLSRVWLPVLLGFDVLLLGGIFALSGGAANPFTVLFLVHVALSAVLLNAFATLVLVALTIATFGSLFLLPTPHSAMGHAMHQTMEHGAAPGSNPWSGHLLGMWLAFGLAALFLAYFVGRLARAMRERDVRLAAVAELRKQNERLALLSSFSANAAHELGTPLATIGLAAKELSLALTQRDSQSPELKDATLISREVARCRDILATLSARAGESMGEMPRLLTLGEVEDDLLRPLSLSRRTLMEVHYEAPASRETRLFAPPKTLCQVLNNLVQNAFEAHANLPTTKPIELSMSAGEYIVFRVQDQGPGLHPSVASRIGRPFVSTKEGEGGLGLGVYLARSFAERIGGSLTFRERQGGGLEAILSTPAHLLGGKP